MKVLKFGGTSVGSPERMYDVVNLIDNDESKIVVLSAMSGTTNVLTEIVDLLYKNDEKALEKIKQLEQRYYVVVEDLFERANFKLKGKALIEEHFKFIKSFTQDAFTAFEEKSILAQGELISTALLHLLTQELGVETVLISALNFMRTDKDGEPDQFYIKENIEREIASHPGINNFITQGYVCRNSFGEIDNLKRGGSDYSASLIGVGVKADEIQIWTDIDGMHNNDPRVVSDTYPLPNISFDEAAELAYFGAKILHPSSVLPAKKANIPVRLKNTMEPFVPGTLIDAQKNGSGIKAIAAKDNITAIKIKSDRMLLVHGFLRRVFEIFETYKTPIDMVTTSEVAVSVTIDDSSSIEEIKEDLANYGAIEIDKDLTIVCVVGDFIAESKGYAQMIFKALENIPIRMISYGGSRHNVSILINTSDKEEALVSLNENLFQNV
ncbi:MAG: aspartate kinase [Vicingaceae bacterium]|nr:aspartate kinase [Vicingaceae bacterium]